MGLALGSRTLGVLLVLAALIVLWETAGRELRRRRSPDLRRICPVRVGHGEGAVFRVLQRQVLLDRPATVIQAGEVAVLVDRVQGGAHHVPVDLDLGDLPDRMPRQLHSRGSAGHEAEVAQPPKWVAPVPRPHHVPAREHLVATGAGQAGRAHRLRAARAWEEPARAFEQELDSLDRGVIEESGVGRLYVAAGENVLSGNPGGAYAHLGHIRAARP